MTSLLITALAIIGLCVFLTVFFGANVGVLFFAACAGLVLLDSLDPVVVSTAGALVPGEGESYVRLSIVPLSMVFAAMIFRHSVSGSQRYLHALSAVVCGLMLWLLLPEATGVSWLLSITDNKQWETINNYQTLVIAAGFSVSLLVMLLFKPHSVHTRGKH